MFLFQARNYQGFWFFGCKSRSWTAACQRNLTLKCVTFPKRSCAQKIIRQGVFPARARKRGFRTHFFVVLKWCKHWSCLRRKGVRQYRLFFSNELANLSRSWHVILCTQISPPDNNFKHIMTRSDGWSGKSTEEKKHGLISVVYFPSLRSHDWLDEKETWRGRLCPEGRVGEWIHQNGEPVRQVTSRWSSNVATWEQSQSMISGGKLLIWP